MTVAEALRDAAERLSVTSDTARLDAELLMAHALGVSRSDMLLRQMSDAEPDHFQELVVRRACHEPVAYITGYTEFYGLRFDVEPGVLIPRADSEVLVGAALDSVPNPKRVLDMGTGSGALLLTILAERSNAHGIGIDASEIAAKVAGANAVELDLSERATFQQADWTVPGWAMPLGQFDLVLCNPPYVEDNADLEPDVRDYEPSEALFSGPQGLDDYRVIFPQLANLLNSGGVAVLEIGVAQASAVKEIAEKHGFSSTLRRDLGGRARCLTLQTGK